MCVLDECLRSNVFFNEREKFLSVGNEEYVSKDRGICRVENNTFFLNNLLAFRSQKLFLNYAKINSHGR